MSGPHEPNGESAGARALALFVSLLVALAFVVLFVRTAWISDDARITFRSVEQLHAGNGPRWNPHERVQAFTHPLWFLALSAARTLSADTAGNALFLSALLGLVTLWLSRRLFDDPRRWLIAWGLLLSSKAFVDFSSSGLENPLVFALLTLLLVLLGARPDEAFPARPLASAGALAATTALLLLCRHDLALLIGPPVAAALLGPAVETPRRTLGRALLGALPFVAWTLFAIVYYGFPFPNTAYAKLANGVPAAELWQQGIAYGTNLARWDPLTLVVLIGGTGLALFRRRPGVWMGLGMAAYCAYLLRIGGDFMAGRLFTPVLLWAAFEVAGRLPLRRAGLLVAALLLYAIVLPGSPWTSGAGYRPAYDHRTAGETGITDERGYYFKGNSLAAHLASFDRTGPPLVDSVTVAGAVGATGMQAGLDRIVVDENALCDPLLARLPAERPWRIGHFRRAIPAGYLDSLRQGRNRIENRYVRALYADLRKIAQGPLWSGERWRAIARLNLHPPRLPCAAPPCREMSVIVMPSSAYSPRFWRVEGALSGVRRDQERVRVEGRLQYGDLVADQRLFVSVPSAPLSSALVEPEHPAPPGAFAFELRFNSPAEALAAVRQICVATDSAESPGGLLASRRPICGRLLGPGVELWPRRRGVE